MKSTTTMPVVSALKSSIGMLHVIPMYDCGMLALFDQTLSAC